MSMFDEKEKAFLRKLEGKAKKVSLKLQVLLDMRKKFIKETIEDRLYKTTGGKFLCKKRPFECVFNWDDGPQNVLIEDIEIPYVFSGNRIIHFEETLFNYRVKLKSGKWSKHTYSTEADDWALEQIENHISQSKTEAGQV